MCVTQNKQPHERYHNTLCRPILPFLPEHALRVLDIGGGSGATAIEVKKRCSSISAGVIDIADITPDKALDFFVCGDAENEGVLEELANQYGPFDLVLCLDSLEHMKDPWTVVHRIHKTLSPNGYIIASIPNIQHYSAVIRLLIGTWDYRDSGILDRTHLRFFIKKTAIDLVKCSGLHVEKVDSTRPHKGLCGKIAYIFNIMTLHLFKNFFELQYLVLAKNITPKKL